MSPTNPQSKLSSPARKFFACQLLSCCRAEQSSADSGGGMLYRWVYRNRRGSKIGFSQVWLQGIVVMVSVDGDDVLLDDGTAVVHATGVTKIVKDARISKGMYIMIAGHLASLGSKTGASYSSVKVLKVANLSDNLVCEAMWQLEVMDAQMMQEDTNQPVG